MEFPYDKDNIDKLPLEHYMEIFQGMDPLEISGRCHVPYDETKKFFTVNLMGVNYEFDFPTCEARHLDGEELGFFPLESRVDAKILMLRYLTEGNYSGIAEKFLAYREVPGGDLYFKPFQGRCLFRLAFGFGNKIDLFRKAMEKLGATPVSSSDAGYEFVFMSQLRLRFLLWEGDEEFPPSAQILFSENFLKAFNGYDLAVVGDVSISVVKALSASV